MTCIACGDTGLNSKGDPCHPCQVHGRPVPELEPLETDAMLDVALEGF